MDKLAVETRAISPTPWTHLLSAVAAWFGKRLIGRPRHGSVTITFPNGKTRTFGDPASAGEHPRIVLHNFDVLNKTLKRGTLVGQQTAGGVISTGGTTLIDGTSVRIPFRGWFLPDGTNMENNGAKPDIVIIQTPEDESSATDAQLRAAVDDLMKRIQ